MATFTAQILIGHDDPYHEGIIPYSYMFLSENSRPAWILRSFPDCANAIPFPEIVWIPTLGNIVEDAMLMIGIYIVKDNVLIDQANNFLGGNTSILNMNRVDTVRDHFTASQRQQLYQICKNQVKYPKIIYSILEKSSSKIKQTLQTVLSGYKNLNFKILSW